MCWNRWNVIFTFQYSLLSSCINRNAGWLSSSTFAIAFIFAFIVVYDALNLRYQCGLHAKEINEINRELHRPAQLNESLGHRMCEVSAGCMIGIIIAWI